MVEALHSAATAPWVQSLALLCLCAAYLQGGLAKARDFAGAVAEMRHFGLAPAAPLAAATIALQLGALALAGFTVLAAFVADRFWQAAPAERRRAANAFFEHWGLAGGFVLVAWHDLGGLHGT
ncbi:DoxX family protein [Acidovorax sp. A1169]|uniref:DoxX family protein n=1 Tax=Acidovorax sp. A1169 TaxID=3059524 RepID=UPI0027379CDB|nr:DoxX family protein [Acidovorax sp. A1169]MDP4074915.1 DoxX family protein [Acidovorax sp. A1169]